MKIYSLIMTKESFSNPPVLEVFGSYGEELKARSAMIDWIVDMAQKDSNFANALWTDENHSDFCHEVRRMSEVDAEPLFYRDKDYEMFPCRVSAAMRSYLDGEIGAYYVVYSSTAYDRDATYAFHVVENNLDCEG